MKVRRVETIGCSHLSQYSCTDPLCISINLLAPTCCAGAGAVAARAEIMGFFRVELLRRIAMELLMPWVLYWMSVKRVRRIRSNMVKRGSDLVKTQSNFVTDAAGAVSALVEEITPDSSMDQPIGEDKNAWKLSSATAADTRNVGSQRDDAVSDCCKPSYDIFTDCWELNRDLG